MVDSSNKDCSRCSRGRGEAFWCFKSRYVFDVDLAREYVREGHELSELDPDDVAYSVNRTEVNEEHVAHVDPSIPGIVAHVFLPDEDGTVSHGHRLIDGHHRAARCQQLGIPFPVYVLTALESQQILIKAPRGARPDLNEEFIEEAERQRRKEKKQKSKVDGQSVTTPC